MKKTLTIIMVTVICILLFGCLKNNQDGNVTVSRTENVETTEEEIKPESVPDLSKVKSICELSTLKCYYHNVAKFQKKAGTGASHFLEKERDFWIEYTGVVEISYKTELIQMEQKGTNITIILPEPNVDCVVDPDSWNEDSYVAVKDQWIQKNPITANDQTEAINTSKKDMEMDVRNN